MNSNFNLFFYGLGAKFIQFIGVCIIIASLFGFLVHWAVFLIGLIIGIGVIMWGKAMRFDYQRQSGSILHRGDW